MINPTRKKIMAARKPKDGWTEAQLIEWGVSWPPPKGWLEGLNSLAPTQDKRTSEEA